jgi:hypothetical protein
MRSKGRREDAVMGVSKYEINPFMMPRPAA